MTMLLTTASSNVYQVYQLVLKNVFYIENMKYDLIPTFILREASLIVNEEEKIHCKLDTEGPYYL